MEANRYLELSRLDCSPGVEIKHGGLSYLSWSYAWHLLVSKYPDSTYYFGEPYVLPGNNTVMVKAGVTVKGLTHEMQLPCLDNRNRPLSEPNAFDYNSAQMRCLVKAIAMHGVGISLYLGDIKKVIEKTDYEAAQDIVNDGDPVAFHEFINGLSEEAQKECFNAGPPGQKTKWKETWRQVMKKAEELLSRYTTAVQEAIAAGDAAALAEIREELTPYEMKIVGGRLSADEQKQAKEMKQEAE